MPRFDYGHPVSRIPFVIVWLDDTGAEIMREEIRRRDLSEAITAASNLLKKAHGRRASANGFYVKSNRDQENAR